MDHTIEDVFFLKKGIAIGKSFIAARTYLSARLVVLGRD